MAPRRRHFLAAVSALGAGCSAPVSGAGSQPQERASARRPNGAGEDALWWERVARLAQLRLPAGVSVERAGLDCWGTLWARVAVDVPALLEVEAQLGGRRRDAGPFYHNGSDPPWWGAWPTRMSVAGADRLPGGGARLVWIDHTPGGFAGDSPGANPVVYVKVWGLPADAAGEAQAACASVTRTR